MNIRQHPSNALIAGMLLFTVLFWGANNTGLKFLVREWPPFWVISSRIWVVGGILALLLRYTKWLGVATDARPGLGTALWLRASFSLAAYFGAITYSLKFISAPQMALHLATSPVWGLLFEQRPRASWTVIRKYAAAALALGGVVVLLWPKIRSGTFEWRGDALAQIASILWTFYGRECRALSKDLSGAQITCASMWRAAVWLAPLTLWELATVHIPFTSQLLWVYAYCTVFGGIVAFAFYAHALKFWPVSQVFLFNNLIPASTMAFSWLLMGEKVTDTFWIALTMVATAVVAGRSDAKADGGPTSNPGAAAILPTAEPKA
jgi:drug/metabolite transporter (DMT)-like permease